MTPIYTLANSIKVFKFDGYYYIFVADAKFCLSHKGGSLITDINDVEHSSTIPISVIKKRFKGFGLMVINKGILVNLNFLSLKKEKTFNSKIVNITGGHSFNVGEVYYEKINRSIKKHKLPSWLAYRKLKRKY